MGPSFNSSTKPSGCSLCIVAYLRVHLHDIRSFPFYQLRGYTSALAVSLLSTIKWHLPDGYLRFKGVWFFVFYCGVLYFPCQLRGHSFTPCNTAPPLADPTTAYQQVTMITVYPGCICSVLFGYVVDDSVCSSSNIVLHVLLNVVTFVSIWLLFASPFFCESCVLYLVVSLYC